MCNEVEQLILFDPECFYGKTSPEHLVPDNRPGKTSASLSRRFAASSPPVLQSLDLNPGAGNLLGESYWELTSPWLGASWTPSIGACPVIWKEIVSNPVPRNGAGASFLSQILQAHAPRKYYLTKQACLGVLRRAEERGKALSGQLHRALSAQAGIADEPTPQGIRPASDCLTPWDVQSHRVFDENGVWPSLYSGGGGGHGYVSATEKKIEAYAANQRDEVRDLHDVAAALSAQPGMKQQTFVAGFCAGAAPTAGNIGYQEEISPTLKAGGSGTNMVPSLLCINDQGGQFMDVSENISGTLRADMGGHQPLVADAMEPQVYCIISNAIDREPQHGGNGLGYNDEGVCYTVTASDHHAVFSRQRVDVFREDEVASTESARQHKDATDLVCEPYQETVGTLVASDSHGVNNQYVGDDKCVVEENLLIRRLTPMETERLQGFPDGWTDIEGASDTARYKAMGNSVNIPCVEFIMAGIAKCLGGEGAA